MQRDPKSDLRIRTKAYALRIIRMYTALPKETVAQILGKQVLRSGTSVGAQYREAVRARSKPEFVSKLESALQELEETGYWLELLTESGVMPENKLRDLLVERDELNAMITASVKTVKQKMMSN